jgi:hypothetical protein
MYEASGLFAVTSASSAFSAAVPAAAICASCKPALLHGDGCGAAAVHGMHGTRPMGVRAAAALRPDRLIGHGHAYKAPALARACVRVRVRVHACA